MAIANVVTRGFGPGAAIKFVVTRGYSIPQPTPTPSGRIVEVAAENRIVAIAMESRIVNVAAENRSVTVPAEDRIA